MMFIKTGLCISKLLTNPTSTRSESMLPQSPEAMRKHSLDLSCLTAIAIRLSLAPLDLQQGGCSRILAADE